jgi:hypothetical protein
MQPRFGGGRRMRSVLDSITFPFSFFITAVVVCAVHCMFQSRREVEFTTAVGYLFIIFPWDTCPRWTPGNLGIQNGRCVGEGEVGDNGGTEAVQPLESHRRLPSECDVRLNFSRSPETTSGVEVTVLSGCRQLYTVMSVHPNLFGKQHCSGWGASSPALIVDTKC